MRELDVNVKLSQKVPLVTSILDVRCFTVGYVGTNPPILCSRNLLFYIHSLSSGDSDLIGVEENPEFSPYGNSGLTNDGFTPASATERRVSVNPMFAAGLSQLSAAALQQKVAAGKSLNPLADKRTNDDYDSENDSRRSSENFANQNNNFTFNRMDSVPTTEL